MPGIFDLDDLLVTPVLIQHLVPEIDPHGDRVYTSTGAASTVAYFEPTTSTEDLAGQTTAEESWLLVVAAGVEISQHDMVTISGESFAVNGTPRPFGHVGPTGTAGHHIEVRLVRADG